MLLSIFKISKLPTENNPKKIDSKAIPEIMIKITPINLPNTLKIPANILPTVSKKS